MNAPGIRGKSCSSGPALLIHAAAATMCLLALSCSAASQAPTSQPINHEQPADAGDAQIPTLTLRHLGSIKLESNLPPEPAIRNVLDFDIDDRGRFGFLRAQKSFTFVLVDPNGTVLMEIEPKNIVETTRLPSVRWAGGDRWVIVGNKRDTGLAWFVDVADERVAPIKDFVCPRIEAITGDRRGGFVVLGRVVLERYASGTHSRMELIGFDSEGRRQWCLPADDENTRFPHEANIGLLSNGDVAVLDNSILSYTRLGLQVFDPAGNEIRKIDLGAKWIFATPYNILAIDQRDRFIIATPYEKRATIRRVCSDGSEDFAVIPRLSNGHEIRPRDGARISPDGRLWVCDGESFLRLDEKGIVDHTLGEEPSDKILREIEDWRIDSQGRTYLTNERTGSVHVFDVSGKRIHVLKHNPQEFEKLGLEWSANERLPGPDGEGYWENRRDALWLRDANGKFKRAITHRPDGKKLRSVRDVTLSYDGVLAIISNDRCEPVREDGYTLNFYTQAGDPIRTVTLPLADLSSEPIFDGRFVLFDSSSNNSLSVFDVESGARAQIVFPQRDPDRAIRPSCGCLFFTRQGAELWLLRVTTRTIERYAWEPQRIEAERKARVAP